LCCSQDTAYCMAGVMKMAHQYKWHQTMSTSQETT
jgi:hypothetical protein